MPNIGQTYTVESDSGIMIVAWPEKDQPREISFTYWAELIPQEEESTS